MSDRRRFRWAATSARMLAGTLAATGFVVGIVTLSAVPWPTVDRAPLALSVTPEPDTVTLACPGGLIALGRTAEDALGLSQAAVAAVTSGVTGGATGGGRSDAGAAEPRLLETEVPDAVGPEAFTAEPANREAAALAAAGAATVSDPDLSGFAASACRPPLTESWLVGGSGTTGAADLVILTNPGSVPATVQLTLFGAAGEQQPAGGADIVVRAGAQRVVPLAGLLLGEQSPVIRVTATGAPIQASLQTSVTRTLQAAGIDQIGPIVAPSSEQVIAGVAVPPATQGEGAETIVRVMAPAADPAGPISATVTATDAATGASVGAPVVVPLEPGVPLEAELTGLAEGEYVVRVEANAPVVAAAWHTSGFSQGSDFGWFVPGPALGATALVAAPAGPVPVLTLANSGDETASVTVSTLEGAVIQAVDVSAGGSAVVPVEPRTVSVIETSGGVIHAGLSLSGDNALAGYPVWPSDAAAPPTVVYP